MSEMFDKDIDNLVKWVVRRRGYSHEDREELYNIVLLRLVQCYPKWDADRGASWSTFVVLLAHQAITNSRKKERITCKKDLEYVDLDYTDPEYDDTAQLLMGCLDQDQRLLIERKYFQQLTNVEIGKIMGVSREAVRMQLKRALVKMRRFSKE